jgi:hypothetical protein
MTLEQAKHDSEDEISQRDSIRSLLTDGELSDLALRATDGTLVFANRCILASRSPVFRRMLTESSDSSVIDVGYDESVLRAIVSYIYLQKLPHFGSTPNGVAIIEAADYFALSRLMRMLVHRARNLAQSTSKRRAEFLAYCKPDCEAMKLIINTAIKYARNDLGDFLRDCTISDLFPLIHPSYIEEILKHRTEDYPVDEKIFFEVLQKWSEGTTDNSDDDNAGSNNRKRRAAKMTEHIRLDDIDTSFLSTTVSASGLVGKNRLAAALETKSLWMNKKLRTVYDKEDQCVWKLSQSSIYDNRVFTTEVDVLDCPIMKRGSVYRWSILVLEKYDEVDLELGAIYTDNNFYSGGSLKDAEGAYCFQSNGSTSGGTSGSILSRQYRTNLAQFGKGSILSFTLKPPGELIVSIDGGTPFVLFRNVMFFNDGFLPAVGGIGRVQFLGFDKES